MFIFSRVFYFSIFLQFGRSGSFSSLSTTRLRLLIFRSLVLSFFVSSHLLRRLDLLHRSTESKLLLLYKKIHYKASVAKIISIFLRSTPISSSLRRQSHASLLIFTQRSLKSDECLLEQCDHLLAVCPPEETVIQLV